MMSMIVFCHDGLLDRVFVTGGSAGFDVVP